MILIPAEKVFEQMNVFGSRLQPFLFGIDFEVENGFFLEPDTAEAAGIFYSINGTGNSKPADLENTPVTLVKHPVKQKEYEDSFKIVHRNLVAGNSYLTNLTFPTDIELKLSLPEIFARSKARYRLMFRDEFVVFSPEIFVQIMDETIRSFPMKGTIDATLPQAENLILSDPKEAAEHNTIVDLIRNDLSMVASDVKVARFRYIEKINTHEKSLLQVSSEISGTLPKNYQANLGNIFRKLLPAGSISGAPKKKTLEIIRKAETYSRGFYTGVFGHFDGSKLDSGVMIRFIKNENGKLKFYSGGGITASSNPQTEYNELIDKVYVPFI
jgi:para-aminobenzoate synthetase component I